MSIQCVQHDSLGVSHMLEITHRQHKRRGRGKSGWKRIPSLSIVSTASLTSRMTVTMEACEREKVRDEFCVTDLKSDTYDITWMMCCLLYCEKSNHYNRADPLVHLWNIILVRTAQNWIISRLMCVIGYFMAPVNICKLSEFIFLLYILQMWSI